MKKIIALLILTFVSCNAMENKLEIRNIVNRTKFPVGLAIYKNEGKGMVPAGNPIEIPEDTLRRSYAQIQDNNSIFFYNTGQRNAAPFKFYRPAQGQTGTIDIYIVKNKSGNLDIEIDKISK